MNHPSLTELESWEDRLDKLNILTHSPLSYSERQISVDYDELAKFINEELRRTKEAERAHILQMLPEERIIPIEEKRIFSLWAHTATGWNACLHEMKKRIEGEKSV